MITLIVVTIMGLGFAFFATQNTANVIVNIANYSFNVSLYLVAIASLFLGLFLSLIISVFEGIASSLTIWGKESRIKQADREITEMAKRINRLQLENTHLQTKVEESKKERSRFYPHRSAMA